MRKLILIALITLIGLAPITVSAQAPAVAPAVAPAPSSLRIEDTSRVLSIGFGAILGMVTFSVASTNMISRAALANLGKGALVFIGTMVGGLAGNWLYARDVH